MAEDATTRQKDIFVMPYPKPITKIITHKNIDMDAGVAIAIAKLVGEDHFPGIKEAKVEFVGKWELTLQQMIDEGIIAFDTGWQFLTDKERANPLAPYYVIDHHISEINKSTTLMVAELLGIVDEPIWADLIEFVNFHDLEGSASAEQILREEGIIIPRKVMRRIKLQSRFGLSGVIGYIREGDVKTFQFIRRFVRRYLYKQTRFFIQVPKEIAEKGRIVQVASSIEALFIITDLEGVPAYSRTAQGGQIPLCVQQDSNGNVQIFINQRHYPIIDLSEVANLIQVLELKKRALAEGVSAKFKRSDLLQGTACNKYWYVATNDQGKIWTIMNGSNKHELEPTLLTLDEIEQILRVGLNPLIFHRDCPCRQGGECLNRDCPFYPYLLDRCRVMRTTHSPS